MKLYNTYKRLILEGKMDTLEKLVAGFTTQRGRKYYKAAKITYRSRIEKKDGTFEYGPKTTRHVFVYGIGVMNGERVIRAFQAFGNTKTRNTSWKTFYVENIGEVEIKEFKWYLPVDEVKGSTPGKENWPPNFKMNNGNIPQYKRGGYDKSMDSGRLDSWVTFDDEK